MIDEQQWPIATEKVLITVQYIVYYYYAWYQCFNTLKVVSNNYPRTYCADSQLYIVMKRISYDTQPNIVLCMHHNTKEQTSMQGHTLLKIHSTAHAVKGFTHVYIQLYSILNQPRKRRRASAACARAHPHVRQIAFTLDRICVVTMLADWTRDFIFYSSFHLWLAVSTGHHELRGRDSNFEKHNRGHAQFSITLYGIIGQWLFLLH